MSIAIQKDKQHQFKGITIKILSLSNLRTNQPLDDYQIFVRICIKQKTVQTTHKHFNDRQILFNDDFFYNTAEIIDDDVTFQVYYVKNNQGISKKLTNTNSQVGERSSKHNDTTGKYIGSKKNYTISRQSGDQNTVDFDITDHHDKVTGRLTIRYEFLERQDIVGGIKCPNLSLRPAQMIKSRLVLENKHTAYKNLYSFWDEQEVQNCQFFPKKFQH